ncbi:hypothetical protein [Streptomyces sp. NPDC017529]|uniref:hypothetical protein n=1 Tax=Streptomyces sp. NPDC017529 TaxID=3365000 RepID=UPI003787EBF9
MTTVLWLLSTLLFFAGLLRAVRRDAASQWQVPAAWAAAAALSTLNHVLQRDLPWTVFTLVATVFLATVASHEAGKARTTGGVR